MTVKTLIKKGDRVILKDYPTIEFNVSEVKNGVMNLEVFITGSKYYNIPISEIQYLNGKELENDK